MSDFSVSVILNSYEIANLLAALKLLPATGEWHSNIISKIESEMIKQKIKPESFSKPNASLNIRQVRIHLNILEHREKFNHHH
jgi:hypothetical protein